MGYIITRCPKCATAFRVTPDQLGVANGSVRCGSCLSVFKALEQINKTVNKIRGQQTSNIPVAKVSPPTSSKVSSKIIGSKVVNLKNNNQTTPLANAGKRLLKRFSEKEKIVGAHSDVNDVSKQTVKTSELFSSLPLTNQKEVNNSTVGNRVSGLLLLEDVQAGNNGSSITVNDENRQKQEPKKTTNLRKHEDSLQEPAVDYIKNSKESGLDDQNRSAVTDVPFTEGNHKSKSDEGVVERNTTKKVNRISRQETPHEKGDLLSTIQPAPVEMLWREDKSTTRAWLWFFGAILLMLLMAFQIATFQFQNLSKVEPYRGLYRVICPVLGCALPDLVDTKKIRVSNLILRSHPTINGVLVIDTILVNSAKFAQPYPDLLLEFNDISNKKIAFRQFYAGEYLGGELAGTTLMPINQPVQLSIEIVDPGPDAVNYQMYVTQPRSRG